MNWLAMVREVVAELEVPPPLPAGPAIPAIPAGPAIPAIPAGPARLARPARPAVADEDDREARQFLQELDPESQEGLWFDALADTYGSRLAAARAYIREVRKK